MSNFLTKYSNIYSIKLVFIKSNIGWFFLFYVENIVILFFYKFGQN